MTSQTINRTIVCFKKEDDEDVIKQYFITIEQQLMMESSSLLSSIFLCMAAHYMFNLSYHQKSGDTWLFIQEKALELSSKEGVKRHASTKCHFSGITRYFIQKNTQDEL